LRRRSENKKIGKMDDDNSISVDEKKEEEVLEA
jgi:hypothetical protein